MAINYRINNNLELFNNFHHYIDISNSQNYLPIYNLFFNLNNNNYNSINLNHSNILKQILKKQDYNKYIGSISRDLSNNIIEKKIFFKFSPLVDPIKYLIGKYNNNDKNVLNLPNLNNYNDIDKKIHRTNNSSYIDSFFSYLSSYLLNTYNMFNAIDFYGSFLGIKENFITEISDDIDILDDSDFFHKNLNLLFKLTNKNLAKKIFNNTRKFKSKINLVNDDIDISDIIDITNLNINDKINVNKTNCLNKSNLDKLVLEYEKDNQNNKNNENNENKLDDEKDEEKCSGIKEWLKKNKSCPLCRINLTEQDFSPW